MTYDDTKILTVLIAMESSSGTVPDEVNYMKAWALLNLRSWHQRVDKKDLRPFEDWKHHERALLDGLKINGTYEEQVSAILKWYEGASNGKKSVTKEEFAKIELQVRSAISKWSISGPNSAADPVNGADDFTDASGLYYPTGSEARGGHLLSSIKNYESNIMTNKTDLEAFRINIYPNSSELYQYDTDPVSQMPIYTFTYFTIPKWPKEK